MFCNNCGNQIPESASFCVQCGTPINTNPNPVVPMGYGNPMNQGTPPGQQFPMNQATPMNQGMPMGYGMPMNQGTPIGHWNQPTYVGPIIATAQKNRLSYILLGIFLGNLGIHNFYAGYNSKGITQLLISLLLGIFIFPILIVWVWVLVEICTVTVDEQGIPFS